MNSEQLYDATEGKAENQSEGNAINSGSGYERLFTFLNQMAGTPRTTNNTVEILMDAKQTYSAMLEAMKQAVSHIHLEFYSIKDDSTGMAFINVMKEKAEEGVQVRVIYDGLGSLGLAAQTIRSLKESGVEIQGFLRPWKSILWQKINYRNHRKIVVIDGVVGFVGGLNIGNEYVEKDPKLGYWKDTHLQIEGEAVHNLQRIFISDWTLVNGPLYEEPEFYPALTAQGSHQVQVIANGPNSVRDNHLELIFSAANTATRRLWITSPYFIPDISLMMALKTAAASRVDVRVMIPQTPDSAFMKWGAASYIEEMMASGVRFYLYRKGFLHSKTMIVDDKIAVVGTANLDYRSFFRNFEITALLFDSPLIEQLTTEFQKDLERCEEAKLKELRSRNVWTRGRDGLMRLLSPLF
jgi:cardiolipin synthase